MPLLSSIILVVLFTLHIQHIHTGYIVKHTNKQGVSRLRDALNRYKNISVHKIHYHVLYRVFALQTNKWYMAKGHPSAGGTPIGLAVALGQTLLRVRFRASPCRFCSDNNTTTRSIPFFSYLISSDN